MAGIAPNEGHRSLLQELIARLETQERTFYERSSMRNWYLWHIAATLVILTSVFSTIVAGVIDDAGFKAYGKEVLIVLSVIGTLASSFLHLFQVREKEALREEGRIQIEDIIFNARSLLTSAKTDEECKSAFHQVRARFVALELAQHHRDVALRSDDLLQSKPQHEGISKSIRP
jgi:hypothetical protein